MGFMWQFEVGGYKLLSSKELDRTDRAYAALGLMGGSSLPTALPTADGDREPERREWWVAAFRGGDGRQRVVREYHPLDDHPSLYRTFAETKTNRESVLNFANKYGLLGLQDSEEAINSLVDDQGIWSNWEMEWIGDWVERILRMRWAIQVWDLLLSEDRTALRKFIHLDDRRRVIVYDHRPPLRWGDVPEAPLLQSEIIIASKDDNRGALLRYQDTEDPILGCPRFLYHML